MNIRKIIYAKSSTIEKRRDVAETFLIISHPTRLKILKYCAKKPRTISEIKRKLCIGYKSVWNHVRILKEGGAVKTEEKITKIGKIVEVRNEY